MDMKGYKPRFDLFNEHLQKVVKLCKKYDLEPMLWSDMYFSIGSKNGDYYDKACKIPASVKAKIPKGARLVYWDYYHPNEEFYLDWIKRHRTLGSEPIMASGIWTWHSLWYDRRLTEQNAGACINACEKASVDEIFFTMWGDDGTYCNFDSAMAGTTYVAERMYCHTVSPKRLKQRFGVICGEDYSLTCLASKMNMYVDIHLGSQTLPHSGNPIFWDDPILAIYYRNKTLKAPLFWPKLRRHYKRLIPLLDKKTISEDIHHALILTKIYYHKIDLFIEIEKAYRSRRKPAITAVARKIPAIIELLGEFDGSMRRLWLARNKPQGLEVLQIRIAGQIRRYQELHLRLRELTAGKRTVIEEMEECPGRPLAKVSLRYRDLATSSAII
jgi:hexosaminidase